MTQHEQPVNFVLVLQPFGVLTEATLGLALSNSCRKVTCTLVQRYSMLAHA